jgi:hypothetical protein
MVTATTALSTIPPGLRDPLLNEYRSIIQNYMERKWTPSELSGGKFCEIVYTILDGYAKGAYATVPSKPSNFVNACRALESNSHVPRSFQILIPRMLPALYEIRNNRNVGHVGGDVDPNHMDATAVLSMCSWVMAELVRVFHSLSITEAQEVVDSLVERRIPLVWKEDDITTVLDPDLTLSDQILLLIASSSTPVNVEELLGWTEYGDRGYFSRTVRQLHQKRFVYFSDNSKTVRLLPPGAKYVEQYLANRNENA